MIPKYAFTVTVDYQPRIKRPPVSKLFETLSGAMAMYNENVGRQDVKRVSITMIIHEHVKATQAYQK